MKKYVLEICSSSYYSGHRVDSRILYESYAEAKEDYEKILKETYSEEELRDKEDEYGCHPSDLRDECENNCNPELDYLDCWVDDEADCYLYLYEVETK